MSQPATTVSSPARRPPAPLGILTNPLPPGGGPGEDRSRLSSYSSSRSGAGDVTEDDGLYSDDGDWSDREQRRARDQSRTRGTSARGASVAGSSSGGGEAGSGSAFKGKGPMATHLRAGSRAPRSRSRARASRVVNEDDEGDDSPGLNGQDSGPLLGGDDEVARLDRGEELVRQRMRDRARTKKVRFPFSLSTTKGIRGTEPPFSRKQEAEKATKKRESDARAARLQGDGRRASYIPGPMTPGLELDLPPSERSFSGPGGVFGSTARSRDPSRSGLRDSVSSDGTEVGGYTTDTANNTIRGAPPLRSVSPFSAGGGGGGDYWPPVSPSVASRTSIRRSSYSSANEAGDEGDSGNPFVDRPVSSLGGQEPLEEEEEEGQDAGDAEDDDDDDDAGEDGEVEYTLKDRQDVRSHPSSF